MKNFIEWTFKNGKMEDWNRVQKIYSWKNKVEISSNLVVQSTSKESLRIQNWTCIFMKTNIPAFPVDINQKAWLSHAREDSLKLTTEPFWPELKCRSHYTSQKHQETPIQMVSDMLGGSSRFYILFDREESS